ncbi:MAG TPA: peptidylprolyl isomerase, partial [Polyangiaceae bacterium]
MKNFWIPVALVVGFGPALVACQGAQSGASGGAADASAPAVSTMPATSAAPVPSGIPAPPDVAAPPPDAQK